MVPGRVGRGMDGACRQEWWCTAGVVVAREGVSLAGRGQGL